MPCPFGPTAAAMAAGLLALSGCASVPDPVLPDTLVAVKASAAPELAAGAADLANKGGNCTTIKLEGGRPAFMHDCALRGSVSGKNLSGFAAFDNAQAQQATGDGALTPVFASQA